MGWCHEFGPQISDGCDHPMVAGGTSCTCGECGAECTGKFTGCADVWARGPRLVAVRAASLRPRATGGRPAAVTSNGAADAEAADAEPASGMGEVALRALLDELIGRCESFEAVARKVEELDRATAGAPDPASALEEVATLGRRVDELAGRLAPVEGLPDRLQAIESAPPPAVAPATDELRALAGDVKRLGTRLSSLEGLASSTKDRDRDQGRLAALDKVVAGLVQGGEQVANRLTALEAAPAPKAAELDVDGGRHEAALTALAKRIEALESTRQGTTPEVPAALVAQLERLAIQVADLERRPTAEPRIPAALATQMERVVSKVVALEGTAGRLDDLERSLAGVASRTGSGPSTSSKDLDSVIAHLERLTTDVAPLRAVPKRVEAIERVQGRVNAIDKSLATLARTVADLSGKASATEEPKAMPRLDELDAVVAELIQGVGQLSARVAELDEVPKRVEVLEQEATSEKLVTSLAKRVDRLSTQAASIKELPQRVEVLEQVSAADDGAAQTASHLSEMAANVQALQAALDRLARRLLALEEASTPGPAPTPDQASDRRDTLARGLGHAIDMIDQLSHQVAVLEQHVPTNDTQPT